MKVIIYGSVDCPSCVAAKQYMDRDGFGYTYISTDDLRADQIEHVKTVVAPGATTIPIVIIDGKYIGGYDELTTTINHFILRKGSLNRDLREGYVLINFRKKDGSIRSMYCTLLEDELPKTVQNNTSPAPIPLNTKTTVFEVGVGWRSFDFNSIITMTNFQDLEHMNQYKMDNSLND